MHATKFGDSTGTFWRGNDYRTKSAVKSKPHPENAGSSLPLCGLCHAQCHHEGDISPAAEEADPSVKADRYKVGVVGEDPHAEEVTLVGPECVTLRVPFTERRVLDFCSNTSLEVTHAPSHQVQKGVAEALAEVTSIRVPKAE